MNFIYFGNGEYKSDSNNLGEIIQHINKNNDCDIVIYGGNYKNSQSVNKENNIIVFLDLINTLSNNKTNLIMFGDYDLSDKSIFGNEINFYKKTNKFKIFNDLISVDKKKNNFVIDDTLIIMFDSNLLLIPNPSEILVSGTIYENLFDNFSKNINVEKNKKIKDLINYQFDSILSIINNNPNVKNIIFITQNPLSNANFNLVQFYKWIIDVHYKLNNFKLYWLCSNSTNFESGIVNISSNGSVILNISQYNVGNIGNISNQDNISNTNENYTNENYTNNITLTSELTDQTQELILSYKINKISNNIGYLFMQKNIFGIDFKFIEINSKSNNIIDSDINTDTEVDFNINLIVQKKEVESKVSKSKSKKIKYLKQYENIIKNVELSEISDAITSDNIDSELSDPDDPYRTRYLKYKTKLFELRKNKKNKKNIN
jgi:hypothetical protein